MIFQHGISSSYLLHTYLKHSVPTTHSQTTGTPAPGFRIIVLIHPAYPIVRDLLGTDASSNTVPGLDACLLIPEVFHPSYQQLWLRARRAS
jgi:hypothetical protein